MNDNFHVGVFEVFSDVSCYAYQELIILMVFYLITQNSSFEIQ